MLNVGLTGGLASGKSHVAAILQELGCFVISMDELGHRVLEPGGEAHDAVLSEFGTVDRKSLGATVFADPGKLAKLNALVHPAVYARARKLREEYAARQPRGICVTEAAILIETGSYRDFDRLILAVCRPEQQIERAMHRDGLTHQQALDRLNRQMPLEEKLRYADFVIDTSGPREATRNQTVAVHKKLEAIGT